MECLVRPVLSWGAWKSSKPSSRTASFAPCAGWRCGPVNALASSLSAAQIPAGGTLIVCRGVVLPTTSGWQSRVSATGRGRSIVRIDGETGRDLVGRSRPVPSARADRAPSVVVWQSETLTRVLQSVLVVPLTTNLDRARLAGTAVIEAAQDGPPQTSVALAFQMRAVPKACLSDRIRSLTDAEVGELELATDEALGRVEPQG